MIGGKFVEFVEKFDLFDGLCFWVVVDCGKCFDDYFVW